MKHPRRLRRPSPAMIVAITALFISLVGTALAGPIAEISGLNKKDKRTVRKISNKVANKRITKRAPGLSVANAQSSVIANVANAANTAGSAKSADSAKTADKAKTADSATNADNAAKLGGILPSGFLGSEVILARKSVSVNAGARQFANVPCPTGYRVIGGGVRFEDLNDGNEVNYNGPAFAGNNLTLPGNGAVATAWQASAVNGSGSTDNLFVWAVCARLN